MSIDTNIETLVINKMTKAKYNNLATKDPTQFYVITDAQPNDVSSGSSSYADKYGIEADYAVHYGILDCPNGLIDYSINNKEIEIQPGVVLQMAGHNTKFTIASKTKYTIEESGKVTLFFTRTESEGGTVQTGFLEAGDVYYQEEEPTNGTTSYLAWWNPTIGLWQFKSDATGNVWRTAVATPIANIKVNNSNTGIMSVNYIGYRIIDDDIFAQLSDIESIVNNMSAVTETANIALTAANAAIPETSKGVANGVATLDSTGKVMVEQLPTGISGENINVTYNNSSDVEETETLNAFCQAAKDDLDNLTDLKDNTQPAIIQTTKDELPEANSKPGNIVYLSDLGCLAYSTGTVWKKIALEDLPEDGDL